MMLSRYQVLLLLCAAKAATVYSQNLRSSTTSRYESRRRLQLSLNKVANEGLPVTAFPLQKCQGDCNRHSDCDGSLMCFQRGAADLIPGCEGTPPPDGTDYCYDPNNMPPEGRLARVGNNGNPSQYFPLGHCLGNCKTNDDCRGNMVCFLRTPATTVVPGCPGVPRSDGTDYCVLASDLGFPTPPPVAPTVASPPTMSAPTESPPTNAVSPTMPAPTDGQPTMEPPTEEPPTMAPPTEEPPTMPPPTEAPPTMPPPTEAPPTMPPPTGALPTVGARTDVLDRVGNNGEPADMFPLGKCKGDCDSSASCAPGLVCFQRTADNRDEPIPGCSGDFMDEETDYCYDPNDVPANQLAFIGNNNKPPENFPLPKCRGDCDTAADCQPGLLCFQNNGFDRETVPGCVGLAAWDGTDYCYDPADDVGSPPTNAPPTNAPPPPPTVDQRTDGVIERIGNNGAPDFLFPLAKCKGDCDRSAECADGLVCFQRNSDNQDEPIPGCVGDFIDSDTDYCYDPKDAPPNQLTFQGNNGKPDWAFPLPKCRGDCDSAADCMPGLICFQNNGFDRDTVPGCEGLAATDGTDYCYDPADDVGPSPTNAPPTMVPPTMVPPTNGPPTMVSPTNGPPTAAPPTNGPRTDPGGDAFLEYVGNDGEPADAYPLLRCQADCDFNSECAHGLFCMQRDFDEPVPGCLGTALDDGSDYCVHPDDVPKPVESVGDNWEPEGVFPLGRCEGDCDGDFDCEGELVCHQRDADDPVPSCAGRPSSPRDYCVHPSDETATPPVPGAFRMKLHWKFGFDWQENFWEEEWCMHCPNDACAIDQELILDTCDDSTTWFLFENMAGSSNSAQLKVATTNLCLELDGPRDAKLKPCDANRQRQFFTAGPSPRTFDSDSFEIYTPLIDGCLTNEHHPRFGERIYRQSCERPRRDDTNWWQKY